MVRNAAEPHDLSEIRGGVRNMGVLRYISKTFDAKHYDNKTFQKKNAGEGKY